MSSLEDRLAALMAMDAKRCPTFGAEDRGGRPEVCPHSHRARLAALAALKDGPRSTVDLARLAGQGHSAMSWHMGKLERSGLVRREYRYEFRKRIFWTAV